MLDFVFSWVNEGEEGILSEHTELLSVKAGEERPEDSRGSQLQPSPGTHIFSWITPFQSLPVWLLWTLELGERGW